MHDDFDAQSPKPVMVEFVAGGISSNTMFSFYEGATRGVAQVHKFIAFDNSATGGAKLERNLNAGLIWGTAAAGVAADTGDLAKAAAAKVPVNTHLRYADTDARGYGILRITGDKVVAQLITVPAPIVDTGTTGPAVKTKATWTVSPTAAGQRPSLGQPTIEGKKPFPLT